MTTYGALVVEQRDGVRVITVAARSRGLVRPEPAVRVGLERHGIDTEIALLTPAEARELAHLLLEVANAGEHGTTG
jgi:hypothetical protein